MHHCREPAADGHGRVHNLQVFRATIDRGGDEHEDMHGHGHHLVLATRTN